MADREKVIKGLEACLDEADCTKCYKDGPGFGYACRESLMRDAFVALKERETTTFDYNEYINPVCTSCGFRPFAGYIPTLKWMETRGYRYCPGCGKAVEWDG